MKFWDFVRRAASYRERHGFRATLQRARLSVTRAMSANRQVLFYCDLHKLEPLHDHSKDAFVVERNDAEAAVDPEHLQQIINVWNPRIQRRRISERFEAGASLWVVKVDDQLAGYGWTIVGRTMEPHYFPLGKDDVHLFDFFVFPKYRGKRINPSLVNHILAALASNAGGRAFIEAAEWNAPQLSSLKQTPFRPFGYGRKSSLFGRTFVVWTP